MICKFYVILSDLMINISMIYQAHNTGKQPRLQMLINKTSAIRSIWYMIFKYILNLYIDLSTFWNIVCLVSVNM